MGDEDECDEYVAARLIFERDASVRLGEPYEKFGPDQDPTWIPLGDEELPEDEEGLTDPLNNFLTEDGKFKKIMSYTSIWGTIRTRSGPHHLAGLPAQCGFAANTVCVSVPNMVLTSSLEELRGDL